MLQVLSLLFWFKLTRMPSRVWSYEQKWIGAVLVGLVFFNNPLVGVEVFFPSLVWTGLSVIGMVTFLALLLLFWLCIIDVVRTSASDEQVCVCARVCYYGCGWWWLGAGCMQRHRGVSALFTLGVWLWL